MNKQLWFNRIFICIRIIVYILIIYVAYKLITNGTRFICNWNEKYGILCPSCGATRATVSIVKGEFLKALKYNLIYTIAIFPLVCIFILEDCLMIVLRRFKLTKKRSLLETLLGLRVVTND